MIQEEERLLMEQSELRVDVIDLTRLAQIKVYTLYSFYVHIVPHTGWYVHYISRACNSSFSNRNKAAKRNAIFSGCCDAPAKCLSWCITQQNNGSACLLVNFLILQALFPSNYIVTLSLFTMFDFYFFSQADEREQKARDYMRAEVCSPLTCAAYDAL